MAGAFTVNMLIKPLDAVLVEFTNDAIHLVDPEPSIGLTSNLWFSIASVLFLTVVIAFITERIIEPRLGTYDPKRSLPTAPTTDAERDARPSRNRAACASRCFGLHRPGRGVLPADASVRARRCAIRTTGELIGNSPFMNGLIALIMLMFLVTGWAYGIGAGTLRTLTDVIKAMEKVDHRPRRHDLPVLRAQPVRRLLHLHQHGHDPGAEPGRRAASRRTSARCRC